MAQQVVRRHGLIERYLVQALGLSPEQAHIEAESWEHLLSEDLTNRIEARLGHITLPQVAINLHEGN
jgi:DtxR family Mn-dependent transcriptional regulator